MGLKKNIINEKSAVQIRIWNSNSKDIIISYPVKHRVN